MPPKRRAGSTAWERGLANSRTSRAIARRCAPSGPPGGRASLLRRAVEDRSAPEIAAMDKGRTGTRRSASPVCESTLDRFAHIDDRIASNRPSTSARPKAHPDDA